MSNICGVHALKSRLLWVSSVVAVANHMLKGYSKLEQPTSAPRLFQWRGTFCNISHLNLLQC